ncbi:MAG: YceI family protein [Burkholderiales bacterium]|nr:YceI family protein [Burkholderiales bacterium]
MVSRPLVALLGWLACTAAHAEPAVYRIDPQSSLVQFEVVHGNTTGVRGRFGPVRGNVTLDRQAHAGKVDLAIATGTVDTGLGVIDRRIRDADILATREFPQARFVADDFVFEGDALKEVRGAFTLRGVTRPLELKALRFRCRPGAAGGGERCGGEFEGHFNRSEFGARYGLPWIPDLVRLLVRVEGSRTAR